MVPRNSLGPVARARRDLVGKTVLYRPRTHPECAVQAEPVRCVVRAVSQRYGHLSLHVETPGKKLVWIRNWEVAE